MKNRLGTAASRPPVIAGAVVALLVVLLGLRFGSGLPGFVHLVSGWFDDKAAPPPAARQRPDPLAALAPELRDRLTAPIPEWPTAFSRNLLVEPRAVCRWLERFKVGRIRLQDDFGGGWICTSDLATFGGGSPDTASSLFVSLRGSGPDEIGSLRLKLNLVDPATAGRVRDGATAVLEAVGARFGWPLPDSVTSAIASGGAAKVEIRRTLVQVRPEFSDPNRINVIIATRPDTGIVPDGGFSGALSIEEVKEYPVRIPPPAATDGTPPAPEAGPTGDEGPVEPLPQGDAAAPQ